MEKKKGKKIKATLKISYERIILIGLLGLLLGIQIKALFLPQSEFEKAKKRIIKNPTDLEARLVLTEELLKNNRLGEAEKELKKISNFQFSPENKLRLFQISNEEQIRKIEKLWQEKQESDPQDLEVLIQKWQEILRQKPDYRDGWLKLALYLIKVGRVNGAQQVLERAKELDPNYEVIQELEKFLR